MIEADYFVDGSERPDWLDYPYGFRTLVDYGVVEILLWRIMTASEAVARSPGLAERYPSRTLFPFAYRRDNDDVACWSRGGGEAVTVIHDFASAGWELVGEHATFGAWLSSVVDDFIDWEPLPDPADAAVRV